MLPIYNMIQIWAFSSDLRLTLVLTTHTTTFNIFTPQRDSFFFITVSSSFSSISSHISLTAWVPLFADEMPASRRNRLEFDLLDSLQRSNFYALLQGGFSTIYSVWTRDLCTTVEGNRYFVFSDLAQHLEIVEINYTWY